MRNNEERVGSLDNNQTNALAPLEFVNASFFVELPSKGLMYPPDHPLHNCDSVEVNEMTAAEEDIITNKSYIEQGVVLSRLVQSVLVDKSIKADSLLVGDKNAIIVQLRAKAYGYDYGATVQCPACSSKSKFSFNLAELALNSGEMSEGTEKLDNGNISITLSNGWVVECRMLNGKDEVRLLKQSQMKEKRKIESSPVTDFLNSIIVSVSGHKDREIIKKAVAFMSSSDTYRLRKSYSLAIPGVDMRQDFECKSCGHVEEMEVPLTAEFFWPK